MRQSYCPSVTICGNCTATQHCLYNRNHNRLCIDDDPYNAGCNYGNCGNGYCIADESTNPPNATCLCYDNTTRKSYCPSRCGNITCSSNQVCLSNRYQNNKYCVHYNLYYYGCNYANCGFGHCIADESTNPPNATCICYDNSTKPYCPSPNPSPSTDLARTSPSNILDVGSVVGIIIGALMLLS